MPTKYVLIEGCRVPQIVIRDRKAVVFDHASVPVEASDAATPYTTVPTLRWCGRTYHLLDADANLWLDMLSGDVVTIEAEQ